MKRHHHLRKPIRTMRNNGNSFVRKLLASVPLVTLQQNASDNKRTAREPRREHPAEREQNLQRIFMVRYRTNLL
jgi:hypothetical protein